MTSTSPLEGPAQDLLRDVEHAHANAAAALDDPAQTPLAAVTWGSAHLAAQTQRVLHPLACRTLPDGRERVRAQAATDRRLELALWQLDRRLTGDVQLQRIAVPPSSRPSAGRSTPTPSRSASCSATCRSTSRRSSARSSSQALERWLLRAPTRPHPDTHHGRLPFWVDGIADRVRDSMDSRTVPTPRRVPMRRPVTRWGAYALGGALPRDDRRG